MKSDTPETDKAEYVVHLGRHKRKVVRPELARKLERERNEALKIAKPMTPERTEALKRAVSAVLMDALQGTNPSYRFPEEGSRFIRWGKVEEAIHATIDQSCNNAEKKGD